MTIPYRAVLTSHKGEMKEVFEIEDNERALNHYRHMRSRMLRGEVLQLFHGSTLLRTVRATIGRSVKPRNSPHSMFR